MTYASAPWLAALAASLLLAVVAARAETADQAQELSTVEQQLQSSKANQEIIAAGIDAAIREQEEISAKLVAISQRIQAAETSISGSEEELLKLNREQVTILASLGEKQDVLSELLAGLQRLEQNPPPALVVEPNDVLAALRGAMMFGTIVPELREEADGLARDLARLEQLRGAITTRRVAIRAEIAGLEASLTDLTRLIERKKELVVSGNTDLASERQRARQLAGQAKNLKQLMESLAAERARTEAKRVKQAAAEEISRRKKEAALRQPRMAFAGIRGKLAFPAQGQIIKRFGEGDGLGGSILGTAIATRDNAQVTAPADGHVEFAGPFRSYGEVLILNPGGGYHILLAGMGTITAGTGEFLRAGEPVGQMGSGPSSVTLLGEGVPDSRPVLYIEFRNNTEAIDSGPWWIGGMKEARG
ncbi:MAG: peptidoglycan DD-metalloendopeptidase family protein [Rhizobiales bacterium]|nr:peptidoglycan DD-metalloendopeptidase family protein [Hyphomicrobiales bacterium]